MSTVTVLSDEARVVEGEVSDDTVTISEADLGDALGWTLKPEGLCREDVCVPVPDRAALGAGRRLDLAAVARVLDRPFSVDEVSGVAALGEPRQRRRQTFGGSAAPFTLPDLHGVARSLTEWRGSKKLLIAFASW